MSDFTDFIGIGFDDAVSVLGTTSFTIAGVTGVTYAGILDRRVKSREQDDHGGGWLPSEEASIVAKKSQFAAEPPLGRDLTAGTDLYRIKRVETDEVTYTIWLGLRIE